jgi:cytochrome bd ubiquinol oxidase subunit II
MDIDLPTAQLLWYIVFIAAIFAYAALDGFDIGVGCLHLFAKTDLERRIFLNAIGPVWDGNSLWVVITAGAMLAGFPRAFGALFSALYIPSLFLLFGYVVRSVAIEFRSKHVSTKWRNSWDVVFALASFSLALGFGIMLANMIKGLPLDAEGEFTGSISSLFKPYALLLGIFTTGLFMLHGALYLNMKTTGELKEKIERWLQILAWCFVFIWALITTLTLIYEPIMAEIYRQKPSHYGIVLLGLVGIVGIPFFLSIKRDGFAFLSSFLIIASLLLNYALGTYPDVVKTTTDAYSLTIYNSSASELTLKILLGFALAGIPLFILYSFYTYKVFRGKVELDTMSY